MTLPENDTMTNFISQRHTEWRHPPPCLPYCGFCTFGCTFSITCTQLSYHLDRGYCSKLETTEGQRLTKEGADTDSLFILNNVCTRYDKFIIDTHLFCLEWRGYGQNVGSLGLGTNAEWYLHQLRIQPAVERKEENEGDRKRKGRRR